MTQEDFSELSKRLVYLETSIYRYRSNRLRSLGLNRSSILDRLEKEFKETLYQTDTNYHNLAKEVRAIRKYFKSKAKALGLEDFEDFEDSLEEPSEQS